MCIRDRYRITALAATRAGISLDAEGEDALMKALDTLKAAGVTIAVVSHKPNLFRAADKILVLRDGRMELFGPREQVLARFTQPAAVPAIGAAR